MLAPDVLVRQFKELHLQPPQPLVVEVDEFLLDLLDILGPGATADHGLDQDSGEFDNFVKVLHLSFCDLPQAEKGVQRADMQPGPMKEQRLKYLVQIRPRLQHKRALGVISGRLVHLKMLVQDRGHRERRACNGTSLLGRLSGLLEKHFLKLVLILPDIIGQVHHAKVAGLRKVGRGAFRPETQPSPLLRVVPLGFLRVFAPIFGFSLRRSLRAAGQIDALECAPVIGELQIDCEVPPLAQQQLGQRLELNQRMGMVL